MKPTLLIKVLTLTIMLVLAYRICAFARDARHEVIRAKTSYTEMFANNTDLFFTG